MALSPCVPIAATRDLFGSWQKRGKQEAGSSPASCFSTMSNGARLLTLQGHGQHGQKAIFTDWQAFSNATLHEDSTLTTFIKLFGTSDSLKTTSWSRA
jgi:hypothetical protein